MSLARIGISPAPSDTPERGPIALRWWIDDLGDLHTGWPEAGDEASCRAIGWIPAKQAMGVIASASTTIDVSMLSTLSARFPGRRWFTGDWGAFTEIELSDTSRRAA